MLTRATRSTRRADERIVPESDDKGPLDTRSSPATELEVVVTPPNPAVRIENTWILPGVPEAFRERIFEAFFRLPGHAEREGGVGLGLSLVRQIAERHGGSIRCEPREGGGSCFVLSLPGVPGAAAPTA